MGSLSLTLFVAGWLAPLGWSQAPAQDPQEPQAAESGADQAPAREPGGERETLELTREEGRRASNRSLVYLLTNQNEDGSWAVGVCDDINELGFAQETYFAWQQGACGLGTLSLLGAPRTEDVNASLRKAVSWLCSSRLSHRGANWDVDSTWASLYGFTALVAASKDGRFAKEDLAAAMRKRALEFYEDLVLRQTIDGGWAYYDDPPFTTKPTWATSFCTALVLPPLLDAKALGWPIDEKLIERATSLVERCALPNGAYTYSFNLRPRSFGGDSINQVPGSLGRTQVCNWALFRAGSKRVDHKVLRAGLRNFFEHHVYLDMARMRPIPHEGWFANAGYFYFFGHYYAAKVVELLPEVEREDWRRKLRYAVAKTLNQDGACSDFMSSGYQITAGTSFATMALQMGLAEAPAGGK